MQLKGLEPARFARLSLLLDEALAVPGERRAEWLAELALGEPETAAQVSELLASMAAAQADGLLETRDVLRRRLAAAIADEEPLLGRRFGPYRIIRALGQGGMGTVWLAERDDGLFSRRVALKLVNPGQRSAAAGERFARERTIVASLDHPGIARLFDAGLSADGQPFLALEYVDGIPLTDYCDERRLGVRARLELVMQVLHAVQFAHASLVIHRDLKPSNILVTSDGQARLLDFGIAKLLTEGAGSESELTRVEGRAFTPDYASPEQITGAAITTASDVYSLGVILYELLCGRRPYRLKRDSAAALEEAIVEVDPPRPSQAEIAEPVAAVRSTTTRKLRHSLAGDLDTIVLKALKKEPASRYGTVDAFAQDLQRHLRREPVLARPDSTAYHFAKFVARNKLTVTATTLTGLAVVAGAAVAVWQAEVARTQAHLAERQAAHAKAVQAFLLDIFRTNTDAQPDPIKARETTARELLDIGARRIATSLSDVPEVQDEMFDELAGLYFQLGLDERAADMQAQRIEALKRQHKERDPRMVDALLSFFRDAFFTSRKPQALAALEQAQRTLDAAGDSSSELRGQLLTQLAKVNMYGSLEKMRSDADQAVALYRRNYPHALEFATALQVAGRARLLLGDYEAAEGLYHEALTETRKRDPPVLAMVTTQLLELADTEAALLKMAEAERTYREALAQTLQHNGDQHVDTLMVEARLGAFLHATGRRVEGRQLLDAAASGIRQGKGTDTPNITGQVHRRYGAAMLAEGNLSSAAQHLSEALEIHRKHFPDSAVESVVMRDEAAVLLARGQYSAAEKLLGQAWDTWQRVSGSAAQPRTGNSYVLETARLLLARGDARAAADVLRRVSGLKEAHTNMLHPDETSAAILVAQAHLELGRENEARVIAEETLTQVQGSPLRDYYPMLEADASLRLGEAQNRSGDLQSARVNLERAVRLREANDYPNSPWLAEAQIALANCLVGLSRRGEAREFATKARRILAAHAELGQHFKAPLDRVAGLGAS